MGKALSFSLLHMMLAVGPLLNVLYQAGEDCWEVLIMNGYWILSNAFSASNVFSIWFFFFRLLMWWITLIFRCWTSFAYLGLMCTSFIHYWIWLADIFLRIFAFTCMRDNGVVFFFYTDFVWLWYQGNTNSIKWVGSVHSSSVFWRRLCRLDVDSYLNVG